MINKTHAKTYNSLFTVILYSFFMLAINQDADAHPLVAGLEGNVLSTDSVAVDSVSKTKDLQELVVESSNIIRRGNMESYIITKDMRKGNRTAGELLRKINGMHYQPFSEALTYLGSSNVVLLVDSLQKDASYIKRQSPDRFDRIDIVPQPTGKYTGYDVLINFHSKPNYVGFETNVRETIDIMPDGNNGKGNDFAKNATYLDATYMLNKLTVTAYGNWNWSRTGDSQYMTTDYPVSGYKETRIERDRKDPVFVRKMNNLRVNIAGDYKFNERHKISFQWQVNPWTRNEVSDYMMNIEEKGSEQTIGQRIQSGARNNLLNSFALEYLGRMGQWNLNVSANYSFNNWRNYYDFERTDDYKLLYDRKNKYNYITGVIDLNRYFNGYKWYLGLSNYVYVTDFSEKDYITGNPVSANTVVYDNLFVSGQYNPSRFLNIGVNAGISAYSNKTGDIHNTNVSPRLQAFVNWNPNQKFRLHASWLMQSGTPTLAQLVDYGQFVSKFKYQEGNPDLRPNTAQMATLNMTFWRKLTVYANYEFSKNGIFNIYSTGSMELENTGERFYYAHAKYQNGDYGFLTLGANFNQNLFKNFTLYFDAKVVRSYSAYQDYRSHVWLPSGRLDFWYSLQKYDFAALLSYAIQGRGTVSPQSTVRSVTDDIMLGVQKNLLNKKLTLALSYFLPVHITKGDWKYRMHSPNMIQTGWGNEQFRKNNMLEFTAIFRFSTGKQVRKVTLQTENANVGSQF